MAWSLQEQVDGEPLRELDLIAAEMIIELVSLHRTLTPPTELSWNPEIRTHVFTDHPMQGSLARAAKARRCSPKPWSWLTPYERAPLTDTKFVHWDFNVSADISARAARHRG